MKTLTAFIQESLICESFSSKILQQYLDLKKLDASKWWSPQWSRITDDMLHEITNEDEARKLQRKIKESNYILWVGKLWGGQEIIELVTWGCDVVGWIDIKDRKTTVNSCLNKMKFAKAYLLDNAQDILRQKIQQERRDARDGATALKSDREIAEKNLERYKEILAKRQTPPPAEVNKILEETTQLYADTLKNYIKKFTDVAESNTPSGFDLRWNFEKMNKQMSGLMMEFSSYTSNVGKDRQFTARLAKNSYDKIKEYASQIAEICTKLSQEQ